MYIKDVQRMAWRNKLDKGFDTENVPQEFALTFTELGEAFDAYRRNRVELGSELADVLIFLVGIAQMTGIDLASEVEHKLQKNAARTYRRSENGTLIKTE